MVVALVLFVFLMNARATFVSLTAIPISILITVLVFSAFGLTINTMTLGGLAIAIGELVDDAVVDVENILRRLRENTRPRPAPPGPRGDRGGEPGGPLRHRLRDDHHRAGVRAAVCAVRHRGPAVCAARHRLHRVDPRLAADVDHGHAGPVLLPAVRQDAFADTSTTMLSCGSLKRANRAAARLGVRAIARSCSARWPIAVVVPVTRRPCCRAAFCRRSTRARSFSRFNTIRAFRSPSRTGSGCSPSGLLAQVPEVKSVGRRTGRAELDEHAEGVHYSEIDVDLARSARSKAGGLRRHPRARCPCCRFRSPSASRSAIGSITCCRACARRSS